MPINNYQGTYDSAMAPGLPGMIATQVSPTVLTGFVETAAIAFGVAVGQGTSDRGVVAGGTRYRGIAVLNKAESTDQYGVGRALGYMTKGEIFVTAASAVTVGDPVTYNNRGAIGAGLTTTIPNARFKTAAAAGALVVVHLS